MHLMGIGLALASPIGPPPMLPSAALEHIRANRMVLEVSFVHSREPRRYLNWSGRQPEVFDVREYRVAASSWGVVESGRFVALQWVDEMTYGGPVGRPCERFLVIASLFELSSRTGFVGRHTPEPHVFASGALNLFSGLTLRIRDDDTVWTRDGESPVCLEKRGEQHYMVECATGQSMSVDAMLRGLSDVPGEDVVVPGYPGPPEERLSSVQRWWTGSDPPPETDEDACHGTRPPEGSPFWNGHPPSDLVSYDVAPEEPFLMRRGGRLFARSERATYPVEQAIDAVTRDYLARFDGPGAPGRYVPSHREAAGRVAKELKEIRKRVALERPNYAPEENNRIQAKIMVARARNGGFAATSWAVEGARAHCAAALQLASAEGRAAGERCLTALEEVEDASRAP